VAFVVAFPALLPPLISFPITGTLVSGFELGLCAKALCWNWLVIAINDATRMDEMAIADSTALSCFCLIIREYDLVPDLLIFKS